MFGVRVCLGTWTNAVQRSDPGVALPVSVLATGRSTTSRSRGIVGKCTFEYLSQYERMLLMLSLPPGLLNRMTMTA